ncbi:ATP-binding domain-containing protein, partial [Myxococcota bacterium]|nr:ATP-binding domain-containing protein [Myxococcota bacterium]
MARFLDATRAHAGIAIWPSGEQALANLLRVTDLARRFESGGATSFRAFVDLLEQEAESGEAGEAPVVEEGTEGVRMMTVHRAKGLEFPVVVLVEPTAPDTRREASRYVDAEQRLWAVPLAHATPIELIDHRDDVLARDRAEAVRLAYVAATRARDLLVVPVCGDEELDGWLSPLRDVVHPASSRRRSPEVAPGCPRFGSDAVAERPSQAPLPSASVAPGLH